MISSQIRKPCSSKTCSLLPNPSIPAHGTPAFPIRRHHNFPRKQYNVCIRAALSKNKPLPQLLSNISGTAVEVKATVTVISTVGGFFDNLGLTAGTLDKYHDAAGTTFLLELVSSQHHPNGEEKDTIKAYASKIRQKNEEIKYAAKFTVPADFGEVGAVLVENHLRKELFIKDIVLEALPTGPCNVLCESWAHSKHDNSSKRVFFSNKSYLPADTPEGLKSLRGKELENLRGDGQGERKVSDRIYDYDVYNDLGDPDSDAGLERPVLGGTEHPYPRRCRTGGSPTKKNLLSESRSSPVYVPRDEAFSEVKNFTFSVTTVRSLLNALLPGLQALLTDDTKGFRYFTEIDNLYNNDDDADDYEDDEDEDDKDSKPTRGFKLPKQFGLSRTILPSLIRTFREGGDEFLLFDLPELIDKDRFAWLSDEEFARQTLAGLNPLSIQLVTEWPLKSGLDPEVYGPPESSITAELIEKEIIASMTFKEALDQKKLFMLDYHDLLLPYVNKVREIGNATLYGSRTVFFLTEQGTLRPVAIELTRPPIGNKPQWKEVYTPSFYSRTDNWLWRLAKVHVCAHDSGCHQLISHWLRTHCCVEPYVIAANRQLSAMHPIYRLLKPHFRYTMEINALARESLINADGIIEKNFSPRKYSMELSSYAYDKLWRFDREALPADLIARGMAVKDKSAKHGLKLTIADYPYANDGLILWDAMEEWISDYVKHYYLDDSKVDGDQELQAWWTEVRTKGHADKKDEPWWPVLKTRDSLIQVLTTIIWVASAHHAAVNFGQYEYGGYFPNHPSVTRTKMPTEDFSEKEFEKFLRKPEDALLECLPSQLQALQVTAVLDILSSHSPDEEYIGGQLEPYWEDEPMIKAAFERLNGRLKELEGIIDARNSDLNLKNRTGAGVIPYQLLKPYSRSGVTGKGIPNSISI